MCCTVRGDLLGAFDSIRQQMAKGSPLDAVLVETTGMADPVPIVRTLRQTPAIAKFFKLDGTVTLVDTKTILNRLSECVEKEDQERHRQIAFADKLLLNKLDLVTADEVVEVYRRLRSYNDAAPIVSSVKGILPPAELTNLRAFDAETIVEEDGHGPGHGHGHGHGHGQGHDPSCCEDGHGHGEEGHAHGGYVGHGHSQLSEVHDSGIGSFGLVKDDMEVDPLLFARWVRIIKNLPEEQGILYRSKGILAHAGFPNKLIFHAVADVTETQQGPLWAVNERRRVKMVFIGKKLDKPVIEEGFLKTLVPVQSALRPVGVEPNSKIAFLAQDGVLHRSLLFCWTKDVLRVSATSAFLRDALCSPRAFQYFRTASEDIGTGLPRGLHTSKGQLWLHGLMPMTFIKGYAIAFKNSKVQMATPCTGTFPFGEPLTFQDAADVEAAGVMWKEVHDLEDEDSQAFVVEFSWRPETLQSFFDVTGSATNSALVPVCFEDPNDDGEDDDLKFRLNLNPEPKADESFLDFHRLSIQLVGGKSSYRTYALSFHTIDPLFQLHITVTDHRIPLFVSAEVFHQWHPVMAVLKAKSRLRFLIRMKPLEKGPLDGMCGCC